MEMDCISISISKAPVPKEEWKITKTRTATLCGRVKIEGCKYKIKNGQEIPIVADQDTEISGKDTSANISLTY